MSKFLQNTNQNLICSIDIETTGTDPKKHDIWQIAVIPANSDLKPSRRYKPYIMEIIPRYPANIDTAATRLSKVPFERVMRTGLNYEKSSDLFVEWFEKLDMPEYKKIMPLGQNYGFDKSFIVEWLGLKTYELCFHPHIRDTMAAAIYRNDCAGWRGEEFPYTRVSLDYLTNVMQIQRERSHDAVSDAIVTLEVYRRLVQEYMK